MIPEIMSLSPCLSRLDGCCSDEFVYISTSVDSDYVFSPSLPVSLASLDVVVTNSCIFICAMNDHSLLLMMTRNSTSV